MPSHHGLLKNCFVNGTSCKLIARFFPSALLNSQHKHVGSSFGEDAGVFLNQSNSHSQLMLLFLDFFFYLLCSPSLSLSLLYVVIYKSFAERSGVVNDFKFNSYQSHNYLVDISFDMQFQYSDLQHINLNFSSNATGKLIGKHQLWLIGNTALNATQSIQITLN